MRSIVAAAISYVQNPQEVDVDLGDRTATMKVKVPSSAKNAQRPDCHKMFMTATVRELNGLFNMGTFELVDPHAAKWKGRIRRSGGVLPSHIAYAVKFTSDVPRRFLKAKARMVAGGNFEKPPDGTFENFSPTAGPSLNRLVDAYGTLKGFDFWSTDCTQAFLNATAGDRDIFVRQPYGLEFPGGHKHMCRLKKNLYGVRRAPLAWQQTLSASLSKLGFVAFKDDPCLMRRIQTK